MTEKKKIVLEGTRKELLEKLTEIFSKSGPKSYQIYLIKAKEKKQTNNIEEEILVVCLLRKSKS